MKDYTELVKAWRHCMTKEDGITICEPCSYYGKGIECENVLHTDAAAAIEALQAEIRESMQKCAECGENEPKRGEWINSKERMRPDMCSVCGCVYEADRFMDKIVWNYCPRCGAKMEPPKEDA